jgi:hypothetical protein
LLPLKYKTKQTLMEQLIIKEDDWRKIQEQKNVVNSLFRMFDMHLPQLNHHEGPGKCSEIL